MKKFALIALILTVGVGISFAATLKVPWFVDNAAQGAGIPPTGGNNGFLPTITLVYLSSSSDSVLNCTIEYFDQDGNPLGPEAPDNSFQIQPFATTAFRPVLSDLVDPVNNPTGQESAAGNAVPDRPRDVDTKKNGSLVITYEGDGSELGGAVWIFQQGSGRETAFGYAHLII